MKTLLLSLSLILSFSSFNQNASNPAAAELSEALIVVVNTADWCPLCQKHGERVENDILSSYQANASYQIIVNDLSTEESKAAVASREAAAKEVIRSSIAVDMTEIAQMSAMCGARAGDVVEKELNNLRPEDV